MKREFFQWLSAEDRLRVRFEVIRGNVSVVVVQYEAFVDDEWQAIVRYDTAHGYFHKDIYIRSQTEKRKKEKLSISDFNEGLTRSIEDLEEHWEDYKKRFLQEE